MVAGRLTGQGESLVFNYGRSYLARDNAIPLYAPELPLQSGRLLPRPGMRMPGCIRDASPDAWGRRVILGRLFGMSGPATDTGQADELTYLLNSGSDRIGALDFQHSATSFTPATIQPSGMAGCSPSPRPTTSVPKAGRAGKPPKPCSSRATDG